MAIPNELSSDIAAAMLAENKSPQDLRKLKEILLQVHGTLQQMSERSSATYTTAESSTSEADSKA